MTNFYRKKIIRKNHGLSCLFWLSDRYNKLRYEKERKLWFRAARETGQEQKNGQRFQPDTENANRE